jgi:hypothetical protein
VIEIVYAVVLIAAFLLVAGVGGLTAYRLFKGQD